MYKIIALGKSEFILGFRLAGIDAFETTEPYEDFVRFMGDKEVGIIITDQETIQTLPDEFREKVEAAIKPVTVVISTDATSNDALRKKIKKSIGVDLWT